MGTGAQEHGSETPADVAPRAAPRQRGRGEGGAVLVLALVFLTTASVIVGALSAWTVNDLTNIKSFTSARSLQNAVRNATDVAIQSIRYTTLLSTSQNAEPPS